jgi:hypothetical protein
MYCAGLADQQRKQECMGADDGGKDQAFSNSPVIARSHSTPSRILQVNRLSGTAGGQAQTPSHRVRTPGEVCVPLQYPTHRASRIPPDYFAAAPAAPYLRRNLSTRPAVSTIFCFPV